MKLMNMKLSQELEMDPLQKYLMLLKKNHFVLKQFYTTNFLENEDPEFFFKRQKRFILEYEVVNRIHHPNIIKTYGIFFGNSERLPSILPEITDNNKKKLKLL